MPLTEQKLLYNITSPQQTFILDVPEGVPTTAVSITVFDLVDSDEESTPENAVDGSPAIDSTSTSLTATSGLGQTDPRLITVTSTAGFSADRDYLLAEGTGKAETVEIDEVVSATVLRSRYPLANAYTTAATISATRITANVLAAWIQDDENTKQNLTTTPSYRVRWVYEANGIRVARHTFVSIVRYDVSHSVVPADVDRKFPQFTQLLPPNHRVTQGSLIINQAADEVRLDMAEQKVDLDSVRDPDKLNDLITWKTMVILQRGKFYASGDEDDTKLLKAEKDYSDRFDNLFRIGQTLQVDTKGTGSSSVPDERRLITR